MSRQRADILGFGASPAAGVVGSEVGETVVRIGRGKGGAGRAVEAGAEGAADGTGTGTGAAVANAPEADDAKVAPGRSSG